METEFVICDDCVYPDYCSSECRCVIQEVIREDIGAIRGESE